MNVLYRIRYNHDNHTQNYIHELAAHTLEKAADGSKKESYLRFLDCQGNLRIGITGLRDADFDVTKYTAVFDNTSDLPVRLYQFDVGVSIPAEDMTIKYFTSDWGSEFYPHEQRINTEFSFGSISGRSCKGFDPWAGLVTFDRCYSAALAWSGSWNCTVMPEQGRYQFSMGHSSKDFFMDIVPGAKFVSASFYFADGETLEEACLQMRRYFRSRLSLLNDGGLADVPMEYNGWWPYEDKYISEDVYLENAKIAKELGFRYAVMDAGWFGGDESRQGWYEKRGDWDIINKKDFPSGMKSLCDNAKQIGILPGIWCEIEAVGKDAKLNQTHSHIIAKQDGASLGYVCLGTEEGRVWAMSVADQILGEYGAKWIKFDYNLDAAPGCNAQGHDHHGAGDGLYAHYMGYYRLLDEIHRKYPDVVIENCSSGGLRMDIEMLSHTHWSHLSDPDYTDFHLQCFWGALSFLHQSACLHFSWSHVLGDHNRGIRNPIQEDMEKYKFDYIIRSVLMGIPGFSYRLPEMPAWCLKRLKESCEFYEEICSDYILNGDAYRLTPQPLMGGKGERFPVFQFNSASGEAVLFAFRLEKANEEQAVYPKGLIKDALYEASYADSGETAVVSGRELESNGLAFRNMPEESSEIVRIRIKSN